MTYVIYIHTYTIYIEEGLYSIIPLCLTFFFFLQAIKQTSVLPSTVIFRNTILIAERFHFI